MTLEVAIKVRLFSAGAARQCGIPEPLPPLVKAFWEHVPRNQPAWRYQESEGERAERQALENLGLGPVEPRPIRGAA
jgi:hypothetical protein